MTGQVEDHYIVEELQENFPALSNVYKVFGQISGKVSPMESAALVRMLQRHPNDEAIQSYINKLLTYIKLTYNEEANEFEHEVTRRAFQRQEKAKALAALEAKLRETISLEEGSRINRNIIPETEEQKKAKEQLAAEKARATKAVKQGIVGPDPIIFSFRDNVLTFMDKVSDYGVDDISEYQDIVTLLEASYGLQLEKQGWLVKTYRFKDKALAAKVREAIVEKGIENGNR